MWSWKWIAGLVIIFLTASPAKATNEDYNLSTGIATTVLGYNDSSYYGDYVNDSATNTIRLWFINSNLWGITGATGVTNVTYGGQKIIIDVGMSSVTGSTAYPSVKYGRNVFGGINTAQIPLFPIQVKNFTHLNTTINYTLSRTDITGNIAYDMFYTNASDSGAPDTEVMVWFYRNGVYPSGSIVDTEVMPLILNGTQVYLPFNIYMNSYNNLTSFLLADTSAIENGEIQIDLGLYTQHAFKRMGRSTNMWWQFIDFGSEFGEASSQDYTLTLYKFQVENSTNETNKVIDSISTAGWTSNVILINSTKDVSSNNVSVGFLWDSFDDTNIYPGYTLYGSSRSESGGYLNASGSGSGVGINITIKDNFNATVDIKTITNGTNSWDIATFKYLKDIVGSGNTTQARIGTDNDSWQEVNYKGVMNGASGSGANKYKYNTIKIQTSGDTSDFYINGTLSSTLTHANITNLKTSSQLAMDILINSGDATAHYDNLRFWRNNTGEVQMFRNNASINISKAKAIVYGTGTNTADLYAKPNSSGTWTLIQSGISSDTWYSIPTDVQSTSEDFRVVLNGNKSDAPSLSSLEWGTDTGAGEARQLIIIG